MIHPSYFRSGDPFALMRSVLSDFDGFAPARVGQPVFPAVNIWQGEDAVAITAELPGVDPADVDISVKDNVLTITGERKAPELPEDARWLRNERSFGKFTRAIRLPFPATDKNVEARMSNGVLRVVVGRPDDDKPRKIKIKAA